MGSYEAGAASAIRGLGSEPWGASRGYDNCGLPSRAPPMARMVALRLNQRGRDASVQACEGRIGRSRSRRYRARQTWSRWKPARLRFLSNRHRHRDARFACTAGRRAATLHLAAPFVAARRCTPTGLKLPIGCTTPGRLGWG